MQTTVTFRHVDPTDAIKTHATEKVGKIVQKYLKKAESAHVILSVNKHHHHAEINIHASHFDISAHDKTSDLYAAIDGALAKVEAQLRKHNDRINHHKGKKRTAEATTLIPVDVIGAEQEEAGEREIIETDNMPAKPLSLDDAILQLDLNHAEFLVFRNSENEKISVVYRRRDGNYGLIAPNG